jgi:hypothetical protein
MGEASNDVELTLRLTGAQRIGPSKRFRRRTGHLTALNLGYCYSISSMGHRMLAVLRILFAPSVGPAQCLDAFDVRSALIIYSQLALQVGNSILAFANSSGNTLLSKHPLLQSKATSLYQQYPLISIISFAPVLPRVYDPCDPLKLVRSFILQAIQHAPMRTVENEDHAQEIFAPMTMKFRAVQACCVARC